MLIEPPLHSESGVGEAIFGHGSGIIAGSDMQIGEIDNQVHRFAEPIGKACIPLGCLCGNPIFLVVAVFAVQFELGLACAHSPGIVRDQRVRGKSNRRTGKDAEENKGERKGLHPRYRG